VKKLKAFYVFLKETSKRLGYVKRTLLSIGI